jgi:hypothetical protein
MFKNDKKCIECNKRFVGSTKDLCWDCDTKKANFQKNKTELEEQIEYVDKMEKYFENNPQKINRIIANLMYNQQYKLKTIYQ